MIYPCIRVGIEVLVLDKCGNNMGIILLFQNGLKIHSEKSWIANPEYQRISSSGVSTTVLDLILLIS
jgi:hypothetical protein